MSRGFSMLEILIVMATLFIITSITIPMMKSAMLRAEVGAAATEAKIIHSAFKRYYLDNDAYPNASGSGGFDLTTLDPLVVEGYCTTGVLDKLEDDQVDAYDAPDDEGVNQEFWLEMTLKTEPNIRFLIADSNDAPLSGGEYYDGIYMFKNGVLTPLTSPVDLTR